MWRGLAHACGAAMLLVLDKFITTKSNQGSSKNEILSDRVWGIHSTIVKCAGIHNLGDPTANGTLLVFVK